MTIVDNSSTTHRTLMALTFLQSKPEKAAEALEKMDLEAVTHFLKDIPSTVVGPVIACMLPQYAARIVEFLDVELAASFLSAMNGRRAAAILRYSDGVKRKAILSQVPKNNASILSLYLGYSKDMIGAWMIADIMLLPNDCTVGDAIDRLKNTDQHTHGGIIYIVNREARLQGSMHVSALFRQKLDVLIATVMQEEQCTLLARATLMSSQHSSGWDTRNTLPVLNREKQLIGVLRHIDLYQGLKSAPGSVTQLEMSKEPVGFWSLYARTLLSLFDVLSGLKSHYVLENKTKSETKI